MTTDQKDFVDGYKQGVFEALCFAIDEGANSSIIRAFARKFGFKLLSKNPIRIEWL